MKYSLFNISILVYTAIFSIIFFSSCSDRTLEPIEVKDSVFSFYGYIEEGESPNYVRVRNTDEPFLADADSFDGTVTFENLDTGEVSTLRDTLITFGQNNTHNFIIEEEILPDTRYLLTAERSDGLESQALASVPQRTELSLSPSTDIACKTNINFVFENVLDTERIEMSISASHEGQNYESQLSLFINEYQYPEGKDEVQIQLSPHNLLVEVFTPVLPDNPFLDPFIFSPTVRCDQIDSGVIDVTYTHYGSEWTTGSPFSGPIDPESGVVENGLGFFGSFIRETVSINIQE